MRLPRSEKARFGRARPGLGLAAFGLLAAGLAFPQAALGAGLPLTASSPAAESPKRADFSGEAPSADARRVADWVVVSGDNRGLPFVIVDKANTRLFAFDPRGALRGTTSVLLGLARGDVSPPGIGDRKLSAIKPAERITPAGRFVAELGRNITGEDILWVDYDAAFAVHRVRNGPPSERRLERLASPSTLDNRISYGCINVPVRFYDSVIRSTFSNTDGIVYVLPETRPVRDIFPIPA